MEVMEGMVDDDKFRRRMSFLGVVGMAFTCAVYLMTLLRPVLEPVLWALFLVIAMRPLATLFECLLMGTGRLLCGFGEGSARSATPRRHIEEVELSASPDGMPVVGESEGSGDLWRVADSPDVESCCHGCCASVSRVIAVTAALAVVLGILGGFATFILEGVTRVKDDFEIYERGAKNALESTKAFVAHMFGQMPRSVVDEISDNALSRGKVIASDLLSELVAHTGNILVQSLMLGLYVMFWLCTPMPLDTKTERIFRRYLFLKGASCIAYGASVSVMLSILRVELATVFGLMSFLFSFIPEVGAFIAMILPAPVILFDSRLEAPFLTLLTATVGQLGLKFLFANIIEVKLVENDATMKMHPVVTLLAVTFFGFVWGPTGMLLSVPMMTYMKVLILSDVVPASYRDPVLVLLEGDRRAPERHYLRSGGSAARLRTPD